MVADVTPMEDSHSARLNRLSRGWKKCAHVTRSRQSCKRVSKHTVFLKTVRTLKTTTPVAILHHAS